MGTDVAFNGTPLEDVVAFPLATEALNAQQELLGRLGTGNNATLFQLAVECALSNDQTLTFNFGATEVTMQGRYQMAPEWADGPCDEACQEWVTGCMLARINGFGVTVRIFLQTADHPGRPIADGSQFGYFIEEGAFFGNAFKNPPEIYACRGRGRDPLYDTFRVCSHPGNPCGIQAVGPCLAGPSEDPAAVPHACEEIDDAGNFRGCHDRLTRAGTGEHPAESKSYDRLVTTYLQASAFQGGNRAQLCSDDPNPTEHPVRPLPQTPGEVGDPCQVNADCSRSDLICYTRYGPGMCTKGCVPSDDAAAEAEACGGMGFTCLQQNDETAICTKSCRTPAAGGEGCPAGQLCTGFSLFRSPPDQLGCSPFCSSDDECGDNVPCNERTGTCTARAAMSRDQLAPDGEPCALVGDECRGYCIAASPAGGVCGSLINAGLSRDCPDDPDNVEPLIFGGFRDDLALCAFRSCESNDDCTEPLICRRLSAGRPQLVCTYEQ